MEVDHSVQRETSFRPSARRWFVKSCGLAKGLFNGNICEFWWLLYKARERGMTSGRNLVGDGIWVAALQGVAAVGQLAGVRLLTEVLPPTVFGQVMLLIGAVALVASAMANPTMQGLLRFYPEYALTGQGQAVREGANSQLLKFFAWSAPLWVAAGIGAVLAGWLESADLFLLGALACLDVIRMRDTALLNAHRAHRQFGIWAVMEAWSRPLLAFALVTQIWGGCKLRAAWFFGSFGRDLGGNAALRTSRSSRQVIRVGSFFNFRPALAIYIAAASARAARLGRGNGRPLYDRHHVVGC